MTSPRDLPPAALDDAALEEHLRQSRRLESAPEHVVQRAFTLWRPRPARAGLLRRLVAAVGFDSGLLAAPALGVRSAGTAQRQWLFTAEGCDIELRTTEPQPGAWRIFGQVLGPVAQGQVEVAVGDQRWSVALDELAEFVVEPLPPGPCQVVLHLEHAVIELPPVTLGAG